MSSNSRSQLTGYQMKFITLSYRKQSKDTLHKLSKGIKLIPNRLRTNFSRSCFAKTNLPWLEQMACNVSMRSTKSPCQTLIQEMPTGATSFLNLGTKSSFATSSYSKSAQSSLRRLSKRMKLTWRNTQNHWTLTLWAGTSCSFPNGSHHMLLHCLSSSFIWAISHLHRVQLQSLSLTLCLT